MEFDLDLEDLDLKSVDMSSTSQNKNISFQNNNNNTNSQSAFKPTFREQSPNLTISTRVISSLETRCLILTSAENFLIILRKVDFLSKSISSLIL